VNGTITGIGSVIECRLCWGYGSSNGILERTIENDLMAPLVCKSN